jgi:AcrR family transcriptional regulator
MENGDTSATGVLLTKKGQRTRKAILAGARAVFGEAGYAQARMTDIAVHSGISLGAVYRYFEDKDEIFAELFEDLHTRFLEVTRTSPDRLGPADLRSSVLRGNLRYFELYAFERDFMRAVVEATAVNGRYMARWSAMYEEITNRFLHRFTSLLPESEMPADLDRLVFSLVCMTEQVAYVNFTRRSDRPPLQPSELADIVTDIWWTAITCGPREAGDDT